MSLLKNTPAFVALYVLFMIPTYILPWFGSNSALLNASGAASGVGLNPLMYLHLISLVILMILCWYRGSFIAKKWLVIFPVLAAIFDFVPGLNFIPLVGTVMHILAIVLGVIVKQNVNLTGQTKEQMN